MTATCPTCGRPAAITPDNPARPFCSERCRLIDLGAWAAERHRIPGPPATQEVEEHSESDAEPTRH